MTRVDQALAQQSPLPAPPDNAVLLGALLTSYRPVSPHFLLRDVLPALLQLDRNESPDDEAEHLFLGATLAALAKVPHKIAIVTSCAAPEESSPRLSWLNNYIDTYMVGSDRDSIQHAKLWLFHWQTPAGEQLQITVSSTNLTSDAFHGQQQAGWSICLKLADKPVRGKPHGALCDFLDALGDSADCAGATGRYIALLERCPEVPGSHYIASVPQRRLAASQRRLLAGGDVARSGKVRIITPSIGNWDDIKDLNAWCKMVGTSPEKVELFWPGASHPWVGHPTTLDPDKWKMPAAVPDILTMAKVQRRDIPDPGERAIFSDGPLPDMRWSHAKLYGFPHGLMLGSHNWSKAAWGLPDGQAAQNFELSIFVEKRGLPIPVTPARPDFNDVARMDRPEQENDGYWLRWAHAARDDDGLRFAFRLAAGYTARAEWHDGQQWRAFSGCIRNGLQWQAAPPFDGAEPTQVRLTCCEGDQEQLVLPIVDLRPGVHPPAGIPAALQALAEDIELELYGGPPAAPGKGRMSNKGKGKPPAGGADYSIDWLLSARRWRRTVDAWQANQLDQPKALRQAIGKRLAAALDRRAVYDPGAAIASEELHLLLSMRSSW